MIPLSELEHYFLDQLKWYDRGSPGHQLLCMLLAELSKASDAQQLLYRIEDRLKEQKKILGMIQEKVAESYQWDIWAFYPLERIEGPYEDREVAHKRMLHLNEQMERLHTLVVVGGQQERRYVSTPNG